MPSTISLKIQIEGKDGIKTVTLNAEDLAKAVDKVRESTRSLNDQLVNSAATSQVIEGLRSVFGQLDGVVNDLTASYKAQAEAETKLSVAMRNTMDASAAEIESVKALIEEQQRMGVVAGDVQTAAAQELATYLTMSDSLKAIIPTLNDMIVQQLGLGASAESATQIATMLGKVMNGQTKALSRYGYEFSEAQEYVLTFGNEMERATVLCDVIGESVGGMNKEFGKTDIGRQQQLANRLDDIKTTLGEAVNKVRPLVSGLGSMGDAIAGVVQLSSTIKTLSANEKIAAISAKMQALAQNLLSKAGYTAAAGTTALKVATAALYATLTLGLTVAVQALVSLFERLAKRSREAAGDLDEAKEAEDAFNRASADTRVELAEETVKLESLLKSIKKKTAGTNEEKKAVGELNSKYGEIFGQHKTAADWYDVLTTKSEAYAKQLGYEAQAKVLAAQKAAKELELEDVRQQRKQLEGSLPEQGEYRRNNITGRAADRKTNKAIAELATQEQQLAAEVKATQEQFDTCIDKMSEAAAELNVVAASSDKGGESAKKLAKDIEDFRTNVERSVQAEQLFNDNANELDVRLEAMESGIKSLINKYGIENSSVKALADEYGRLLRVKRMVTEQSQTYIPQVINRASAPQSAVQGTSSGTISARPQEYVSEYDRAVAKYLDLQTAISSATPGATARIREQMEILQSLYSIRPEDIGIDTVADSISSARDAIGGLAGMMSSLGSIVDDSAASWLEWGAGLLSAVSQALPALSSLFAANTAVAGTGAMASVANIPFAGPVMAVAALASIVAAAAKLPKFAAGGLAYGPTLGLFGEYPGAAHNPEVVAPLSRLPSLLGGFGGGKVEFVIKGRTLQGILHSMDRFDSRSNG